MFGGRRRDYCFPIKFHPQSSHLALIQARAHGSTAQGCHLNNNPRPSAMRFPSSINFLDQRRHDGKQCVQAHTLDGVHNLLVVFKNIGAP